MAHEPNRQEIATAYRDIQALICSRLASADGKGNFGLDEWTRAEGGGGLTRILHGGAVLEKAGVNFSEVEGKLSSTMQKSLQIEADTFFATGVSIVMHPFNPHVPIIHMNIRYFETDSGRYWFGGGIDLTPHYVVPGQAAWFHGRIKSICDQYDETYYPRFKDWADDYFFIPHRNETRGVGGIFYDHLEADDSRSKRDIFNFSLDLGRLFPEIYAHLMHLNCHKPFSPAQKQWQLLRRGRYVEFNLVYDRGTRFGLVSNGRTESILMSLPAQACWEYDYQPAEGSEEAFTIHMLRRGMDWLALESAQ